MRPESESLSSRKLLVSALGAALFILSLGALDSLTRGAVSLPALLPPFGASTVIVFFAPESVASRTWNVVVGHLGSALVALAVLAIFPDTQVATQAALAVSGASLCMVATKSVHPPGGATALLAVLSAGGQSGGAALLLPVLLGCLTLISIRRVLESATAPFLAAARASGEALVPPLSQSGDSPGN